MAACASCPQHVPSCYPACVAPNGPPTDARLALILRRLGAGGTITAAGVDAGVTRKTIRRWRSPGAWCVVGFDSACERVTALAASGAPGARSEIDKIVHAWTPVIVPDDGPSPLDAVETRRWAAVGGVPVLGERDSDVTEPDVLDTDGREIVASRSNPPRPPAPRQEHLTAEQLYPSRRGPTHDEWTSMMTDLVMDPTQPASVRCAAIASNTAAFANQAPRRVAADQAEAVVEAARERGRDPGVPASVWQEARQNFLGPAPEPEPEADKSGDVVEFERPGPTS